MKLLKKKAKWHGYQFHHRMKQTHGNVPRFTACVQIPSKKKLIEMAQELVQTKVTSVSLKVGVSVVNPKDTYSKKIGRELSHSRLERYKFEIHSALAMNMVHEDPPDFELKNDSFTNIELQGIGPGRKISLYFKVNKLNKVVLGNVQLHIWPDYNFLGYKKKLTYDDHLDQYLGEEEENAI